VTGTTPALRPYQETAVDFLLAHPRAILGDPPGIGKTPIVLRALERAGAARTLLVVPNGVVHHWTTLAGTWFPDLDVTDGRGTATQRRDARRAVAHGPAPATLVINYESFRRDVDALAEMRWDFLVGDEGHRWKNRAAQVTKAAVRLSRRTAGCWVVTGTPIVNRPDEVWSLLHLLDFRRWPSYWRWVDEYCFTDRPQWRTASQYARVIVGLRPGTVEKIRAELADVLLQRPLEALLPDLPPVTTTTIEVDLDAEERRAYDELRRRHWTRLEDGTVVQSVNEVSRITRFRQIVSDMEALGCARDKPGSKIAAALELIADLEPEQVVILTWSRAAAERLAAETGGLYIHGGVAGDERHGRLEAFRAGKARTLAGTLATLGEGIDGMQVAQHVVLLDRPWRPSDEDQAIGRLRRSGQGKPVFAWMLCARGTVDVWINKLLSQKRSVIDAIRSGEATEWIS
jgi:SWI/SNF-related matrix-associated actin-dependent regulator of chromatin subfamily A-like protein 1